MSHEQSLEQGRIVAKDVELLVAIVGRAGAIQALAGSDLILIASLRDLANDLGLIIAMKDSKKIIAERIVKRVDRRIKKSLEELQTMTKQEIATYLTSVGCDAGEIIQLLTEIDFKVQANKSREALIEFAAVQINSLGVFQRLSEKRRDDLSQDAATS